MKCAGYYPLHVIAQAGKDLGMITSIEALDIALDGTLVRAHALYPDECDEDGANLAAPKSLAILLAHLSPMLGLELRLSSFSLSPILIDRLTLAVFRKRGGLLIGTGG
jgi:hypothetical protein